ncbi:hypothetical protein [Aureibacter tunicatorum]|uniref:Uncharacterized protein n=1 Tax=Aureibacter tunicatorum TaxID=866807 RepID=A0AAE3XSA9_9BACT|nr:hypothetical protein [Aureibacter tunicatorum]MDR6240589.1 hypothetical protein [Aureibacter tunicatorum]BDD06550.1 hypothetical protein AUTU_40330 [Aureibacter tunicatorum]
MSYLNTPRLTFSGRFQADPSTVNNDVTHYNNATFQPNYQDYQTDEDANGWWNPDGTGNFKLSNCTVKKVYYKDGSSTTNSEEDPIIGMNVSDINSKVAGKIVDLDPQQQMVSELWGLVIRINENGTDYMMGDYEVAPFTNIWFNRSTDLKLDAAAAAIYQSVIKNIKWDIEGTNSRYLKELYAESESELSIQFTVDRYNGDFTSSDFTYGRIVGSIGPSKNSEPKHGLLGRQLFPLEKTCNYGVAIFEEDKKKITLDLANSLQFGYKEISNVHTIHSGVIEVSDIGVVENKNLALAVNSGTSKNPNYTFLGKIDYKAKEWYEVDAGVSTFNLSEQECKLVADNPLEIVSYHASQRNVFDLESTISPVFQEQIDYVFADNFVFRMNDDEKYSSKLFATRLGNRLANKAVNFQLDTTNILGGGGNEPELGIPTQAISFPNSIQTNSEGEANLEMQAFNPGDPRIYIDGQLYAISYALEGQMFSQCNPNNFLSIHIYTKLDKKTIAKPTWADLQPIMQQYANLYPLMSKGIFNLASQQVVDKNAEILKFVFSKEKTDPNYMPATRDLSRDKSQMILNYLDAILEKLKDKA